MRIIEVNCFLIDRKLLEMEINQSGEAARLSINLDSIESVREIMDDRTDEISKNECCVYMKSGENFIIEMTYDELVFQWKLN